MNRDTENRLRLVEYALFGVGGALTFPEWCERANASEQRRAAALGDKTRTPLDPDTDEAAIFYVRHVLRGGERSDLTHEEHQRVVTRALEALGRNQEAPTGE